MRICDIAKVRAHRVGVTQGARVDRRHVHAGDVRADLGQSGLVDAGREGLTRPRLLKHASLRQRQRIGQPADGGLNLIGACLVGGRQPLRLSEACVDNAQVTRLPQRLGICGIWPHHNLVSSGLITKVFLVGAQDDLAGLPDLIHDEGAKGNLQRGIKVLGCRGETVAPGLGDLL